MARSGLQHVHRDERRRGSCGQGLRQHKQSKLRRPAGKGSAYIAGFAVDCGRKRDRGPRGRSAQRGIGMKISSRVVVIPQENIDTDQIIPARFLKVTGKAGLGSNLFADRPEFRALIGSGSQVLVAGNNFGCGSSREHAPWALGDFGFKAVISTSFADIFRQNSLKNGLLPIVVDAKTHALLQPGTAVSIDLAPQTLSITDGPTVTFPIDSFSKTCILEGLDQLRYILHDQPSLASFENRT